jgi:carbon monoxide dehydrogenase subunit G
MTIVLEHAFVTERSPDQSYAKVLDLETLIPCVEGGRVVERIGPDAVRAEIVVRMGAMSLTFAGTVDVAEQDPDAKRVALEVKSEETTGQGYANAHVEFALAPPGGTIHTAADITGKAASMGAGVVTSILDAMIRNFAERFGCS